MRDYIHVVDLAKGHIAALKKLKEGCGCKVERGHTTKVFSCPLHQHMTGASMGLCAFCLQVYNLGTGRGYSVLQMVKAMEKASGKEVSIHRVLSCIHKKCLLSQRLYFVFSEVIKVIRKAECTIFCYPVAFSNGKAKTDNKGDPLMFHSFVGTPVLFLN